MRYIDADKLVEMYERSAEDDWNKKTAPSSWAEAFECAIADIDDQPTADVVPKSEVERLEKDNEDLRNVLTNTINKYRNCEAEVAKEIFEEIEREIKNHGIAYAQRKIAELKKKYTEGEQRND